MEKIFAQMADQLLRNDFNRNSFESKITLILKYYFINHNFNDLFQFLSEEKLRMGNTHFHLYYGSTVLEDVDFFCEHSNNDNGIQYIIKNMKSKHYSRFNWDNFEILLKENLLTILDSFETYFRGNIKQIHRIYNDKYVIIESERIDKISKELETTFYILENNKTNIKIECYDNFERALFNALVGPHLLPGIEAIYEYSKKG